MFATGSPGPSAGPGTGSCVPRKKASKSCCDAARHRTATGGMPQASATPTDCSKHAELLALRTLVVEGTRAVTVTVVGASVGAGVP
eukprot:315965-Rhodomonas_salina.1